MSGSEDSEWRGKLGGPVFLGDSVHGFRCRLAREKVGGKKAASSMLPTGWDFLREMSTGFGACGPGAGKR